MSERIDRVDRRIRELCQQLRREDEANAPSLAVTLAAARQRRERGDTWSTLRRWAPAAAGVLLVALLGWYALHPPGPQRAEVELADWLPPSAVLLGIEQSDPAGRPLPPEMPLVAGEAESPPTADLLLGEMLPSDVLLYDAEWTLQQEESGL